MLILQTLNWRDVVKDLNLARGGAAGDSNDERRFVEGLWFQDRVLDGAGRRTEEAQVRLVYFLHAEVAVVGAEREAVN